MENVLFFEGAGMDFYSEVEKFSDVGNFRIRTVFKNLEGKKFYIELGRSSRWGYKTKKSKKKTVLSEWGLRVDHLHEIVEGENDNENKNRISTNHLEVAELDYSKKDIVKWINENLNCNFSDMEVLSSFYGYHVHTNGYSYMEDIEVNRERAEKRENAFNEIDMLYRKALNERYSKISLLEMDSDSITIRCYASDQALEVAKLPRIQRIEIK